MIGIFDSGLGGLTVLRIIAARFPGLCVTYLGDQANVPYGNRTSEDIVALTQVGVEALFDRGAKLVLLGCNTATAVAARELQQSWLPTSHWKSAGHNLLGIVAPTVEAATHTPWAVTTPQYPQKNNTELLAVFGTRRTVASNVYAEEISKRCPKVRVVQQECPGLAGAIEDEASDETIAALVSEAVTEMLQKTGGAAPDRAILGCTHFPLVENVFAAALPPTTRLLSQPTIVADSFDDYLHRHPEFGVAAVDGAQTGQIVCLTTGDPARSNQRATLFWPEVPAFKKL